MKNLFRKARNLFSFIPGIRRKSIKDRVVAFAKRRPVVTVVIALVLFIVLVSVVRGMFSAPPERDLGAVPVVSIAAVKDLSLNGGSLSLVGEVQSETQSTVRTEASGQVLYVRFELGDFVSAGAVIAELENSRERAALAQTEAALQSARAQLLKTEAGSTREIQDVRTDAINEYRSAFTLASDAIFNKTDSFFAGARTSDPKLNIQPFGKFSLEDERAEINDILSLWESALLSRTDSENPVFLLESAQSNLLTIKSFLDELATIVNRQTPSGTRTQTTIDTEKAGLFTARTNVDNALSSVTASLDTLAATDTAGAGGTGEQEADVAVARAAVAQAEANVAVSRAALEKTILRAPISGSINSLSIETGDFVNNTEPVASIANNRALEIRAFVGESDDQNIVIGLPVTIDGGYDGVITNVAPALNPDTKKREIRIGVEDTEANLVNGSSVRFSISRAVETEEKNGEAKALRVPLSAVKFSTGETFLFSVSPENILIVHPVEIGRVVGSSVEVSGIEPTLFIVTDARGLNGGEEVEVASP